MNISLVEHDDGLIIVHDAGCPYVRHLAEIGVPVATLFGCNKLPDLPHAPCLEEPPDDRA